MKFIIIGAAALMAAGTPASASEMLAGPYNAQVLRVIDGDTVEARVRLWLDQDLTVRVRLRGIDAPEMHEDCADAAEASRTALTRLLGAGAVTLTRISYDKYGGRVDAALSLADGRDVSAVMLSGGYARRWPKGKGVAGCP
ncbi:MAG: thermonuclease family protein [Rhodospirillaceae bacterium]|nr:thermonuclease family protein [Rhodospirillales bacterium]